MKLDGALEILREQDIIRSSNTKIILISYIYTLEN
jgi:hypothetical protein